MTGSGVLVVGREHEQASIEAWLETIVEGSTGLLIEGEAGIGKTTILRAGIDAARSAGFGVLVAQPTKAEEHLSFTGLADLLEPVVDDLLPALPPPQQEALEWALLRRAGTDRQPDPRTVGAATLGCLRVLAAGPAVLVAVDDVQWLDAATEGALSFALRRLGSEPVGALLVRRAAPGQLPSPLSLDAPRLRSLAVAPLDERSITRLLEMHLSWLPSRPTARRVAEVSGGNPLFALELGRALQGQKEPAPGAPLPVPERLRDLVLTRLRALPAAHRAVLLHAAALRNPTVSLLRGAVGKGSQVDEAIEAAEEASFILLRGDRILFAHPLFASVLFGSTRASARRAAHARLAEIAPDPEERARHLALAVIGPDEPTAAELEKASGIARARGASATAAELAELAHGLTPADDREAAGRRLVLAGRHHMDAQDPHAARPLLEAVAASDLPIQTRAEALWLLARIAIRGQGPPAAVARVEECLALLHGQESSVHARFLALLSSTLTGRAHPNRMAVDAAERAMLMARSVGDHATESLALLFHLLRRLIGGHGVDPSMLDHIPPVDSRIPTLYFAGYVLTGIGEHRRARTWLEALREQESQLGDEFDYPVTTMFLAELEWRDGNLDQSRKLAEESLALSVQGGQMAVAPLAASFSAMATAATGDIAAAQAIVEEWRPIADRSGFMPAMINIGRAAAFVRLCASDARGAVAALEPIWVLTEELGMVEEAAYPFRGDFVEALVGAGELERAVRVLEIVEERPSAFDAYVRQRWLRAREMLAAAGGDVAAAIEAGEQAVDLTKSLPMPFETARTQLVHGTVLRRAKHRRAAREMLERAVEGFDRLGAVPWTERARGELERVGLKPGSPLELTATEVRVAQLTAQGMTNKAIAAALSLSVRTVEVNLARIYRKLGVRRRTELVRWMSARDITHT